MLSPPYDAYAMLGLVAVVVVAFMLERWRSDVIAMSAVAVLLVLGILPARDVIGVFANEAPITVAAMFVLSAALERTGVVAAAGALVLRYAGRSPQAAMLAVTVGAAVVSAFMNNTPVVVILTPIVVMLAHAVGRSPSKYLIPLSYATVLGGGCTLLGTSTNIVASGAAVQHGLEPFGLFEITPLGVPVTLLGIGYLMLVGLRLLPDRQAFSSLSASTSQRQFLTEVLIPLGSPLVGQTLEEAQVGRKLGATVVDLLRNRLSFAAEIDKLVLKAGDRIVLRTKATDILNLRQQSDVLFGSEGQHALEPIASQKTVVMEGIVGPRSQLAGRRVADLNLQRLYAVYVLAVHRQGEDLRGNFDQLRLTFGDTLLLEGSPDGMRQLFEQGALVSLSEPAERPHRRHRAWLAVLALVVVILGATLEVVPISGLALAASILVVAGGCLDADEAYAAINWPVMMLIFGSLAMGRAMEASGAAHLVVEGMMQIVGGLGPVTVLAALYFLTMVLTEFLSNNATAILLVPIAIGLAEGLGVDPRAFVVAVMIASSNAFATPVGYQTNTFVYGAGGYRFVDFVRIGVPLNLLVWGASVLLIPLIWPLGPR